MADTRAIKLWRDAKLHPARTLLVILAMAVGLSGAGALLVTYVLVEHATRDQFRASLPVSATLKLADPDGTGVDAALVERVRALPGIEAARARRTVRVAVDAGGTWRTALVYTLADFDDATLARLAPVDGTWPPPDGALVVEQSSVDLAGAASGASLTLAYGEHAPVSLPVRGVARDVSLAPGWMEHVVYLFATPATLARAGAPAGFDELQFRVRDGDRESVRAVARRVQALVESLGYRVLRADVPPPGEHVHEAQMRSLLTTQMAFAILCLLASALLVVDLLTALLAAQGREIAVLKTIGAGPRGIAAMYLAYAGALGAAATAVALPVALVGGRLYAGMKIAMLNFDPAALALPAWTIATLVALGVALPMLAAALPVVRASRRPVVAALGDCGVDVPDPGAWWARLPARAALRRPTLLALGNALRRRGRTATTVLALALGGAVGLGATSLRDGVIGSVDLIYASQRYDVLLTWRGASAPAVLETRASGVDGVARAEAWAIASAVPDDDGLPGEPFALYGVPADGTLLEARVTAGRWLSEDDRTGIVVSRRLRDVSGLDVGKTLELRIGEASTTWTIVGVVDAGPMAQAHALRDAVRRAAGDDARAALAVALDRRDLAGQIDAIQRLRDAFLDAGLPVARSQRPDENRRVVEDHLLMVVEFLRSMAWIMIGVGGMGLASTMGLAVLERRREIGVLRAIGAPHGTIAGIVLVEALAIAGSGWLLALVLAVPMGRVLGDAFGRVMFALPPVGMASVVATLAALGIGVAIALVASIAPARHALRITVTDAL